MKRFPIAILAALLAAMPVLSQSGEVALEGCANQRLSPAETARLCREALRTPSLKPQTRAGVLVNLGVAQAALEDHVDAIRSYSLAIDTAPKMVQAYLNRATSLDALGRVQEALADYDSAIKLERRNVNAWLGRGSLLLRRGAPERAVRDLSQAIVLAPGRVSAWFNRGLAYLELGDYAGAIGDFSEVIEREPEDAEAYLNRGRARAALGSDKAGRDFDKAIDLEPDWANAWVVRGRYHDMRGENGRADEDFRRAYSLGYSQPWLIERLRKIGG